MAVPMSAMAGPRSCCRYKLLTTFETSLHGVDPDHLQRPMLAVDLGLSRSFGIRREWELKGTRRSFVELPPPEDATFSDRRTRLPTYYFPMERLDSIVSGFSFLLGMLPVVRHQKPFVLRRFESYVRDMVAVARHTGDTFLTVSVNIFCDYVVPDYAMEMTRSSFDAEWEEWETAREEWETAREEWETVIALTESVETAVHMTPASRDFVESRLGKYSWEAEAAAAAGDDDSQKCVVCLEEFESTSVVARMPCSHVFHEACITKWLEVSNSCPLCRFEAPSVTSL